MDIPKTVLITGASGLIGTMLTSLLLREGYRVRHLGRTVKANDVPSFTWNINKGLLDPAALEGVDAIVHLAGAGIADKRWSAARKEVILNSRIRSAELLRDAISKQQGRQLRAFITASGIGYYGSGEPGDIFAEDSPPANDFPARVCIAWEKAGDAIAALGVRVVAVRTGVVLSERGGALEKLARPVRFGVGAPLGSGDQVMSWVHIDDVCGIYLKAIVDDQMRGPYNAVAPGPVTNRIMTQHIARVLRRPLIIPAVPAWALRLMLGEMADMVLEGSVVSSKKVEAAGYRFQFTEASEAVRDLLSG